MIRQLRWLLFAGLIASCGGVEDVPQQPRGSIERQSADVQQVEGVDFVRHRSKKFEAVFLRWKPSKKPR